MTIAGHDLKPVLELKLGNQTPCLVKRSLQHIERSSLSRVVKCLNS